MAFETAEIKEGLDIGVKSDSSAVVAHLKCCQGRIRSRATPKMVSQTQIPARLPRCLAAIQIGNLARMGAPTLCI